MVGETKKEECEDANSNPHCPYLVRIIKMETNISWLKKGYAVQAFFGVGTFAAVIGLIAKILGLI